ncbi:MAG: exo-alpha-sialidase [Candidatus Solibacter usitatus]|nr:exo-alpha-sialidase [Candidatus Solibacter usitatus]
MTLSDTKATRRLVLGLPVLGLNLSSQTGAAQHAELQRTKPDYIAFVPGSVDGSTEDSHNEHFLVFDGPDGSMMAVWTQSHGRKGIGPQNRIRFAQSKDDGVTWSQPLLIAGPANLKDPQGMASWGFPLVSKSGRIYVLFNWNDGQKGWIQMHTGRMGGVYSDDLGKTWTQPQQVPMPASPFDDPEGKVPGEWIVWQLPAKDLRGKYFAGYTHWLHPARARWKKTESWTQIESVVEFLRFENVDANPQPRDLKIRFSASSKALRVPHFKDPLLSVAQEPSIARLPDQSLFCVMRTNSGMIWYSVSKDDGETWSNTRPLLRKDHGAPILQPVGCAPLYQLAGGRFLLLHHNNRGDIESKPEATMGPRNPAFIAVGEYRPRADQPLWFSESKLLLDSGGIGVDGSRESKENRVQTGVGLYTSFTTRKGNNVLWHPDRKCFLLGKRISPQFLRGLTVPTD